MSPSTNCENGVTKSVEETKEGDPDAPYKASTPEDQWFVPDELYLVDTHFSRESNENELYIKHDVVTDSEKSDDTHLVWKTYHELTEDHIKSFNALKLNGLYLMIDSKKWELLLNPTNKLSIDRENHRIARRHFNEINNDRIDRIARLIMDNQKYFGKTQETLKDITFAVEILMLTIIIAQFPE
uniref:NR LBD domain-containing protein n=1 Tax=Caenorhabditis tropicalis TaxID=1561998 RepID=A0A1I7UPV5_9PELO